MVDKPAEWITGVLYDDWNPLGANPPASEYQREGLAIAEMLKRGTSREEVAEYLRRAAAAYGAYPVPEERLVYVVNRIMGG